MITVFTNGCFDIIHPGHVRLLKYARSLGDRLIVGLDRDEKIKKDKGLDRPINDFGYRVEVMSSIRYVDEVCSFVDTTGLSNLVKSISPDILVIGSDWEGKPIIGSEYAKEVKFFDRIEQYSTTGTIKDILNG